MFPISKTRLAPDFYEHLGRLFFLHTSPTVYVLTGQTAPHDVVYLYILCIFFFCTLSHVLFLVSVKLVAHKKVQLKSLAGSRT